MEMVYIINTNYFKMEIVSDGWSFARGSDNSMCTHMLGDPSAI
jgi:hypothetical protein